MKWNEWFSEQTNKNLDDLISDANDNKKSTQKYYEKYNKQQNTTQKSTKSGRNLPCQKLIYVFRESRNYWNHVAYYRRWLLMLLQSDVTTCYSSQRFPNHLANNNN